MDIYLNGVMTPPRQAYIPIDDAGFQHAVGLFETMSVYHGVVFQLDAHLDRLQTSATQLGLARELDLDTLKHAIRATISHNQLKRARLRLTLTAGSLSLLNPGAQIPEPTVCIVPSEPTQYDPAYFTDGITALIAPPASNPFDPMSAHKTLNYWGRLRTLRQAASVGAGEAIWLNVSNHLASGAVSNVFLVKGRELYTPIARGEEVEGALPAPVLPGTTRKAVIQLAEQEEFIVHRQMLSIEDLLGADEVFLTNASWLVLPVSHIEQQAIGDGKAGPAASHLRKCLEEYISDECEP